MRHCDKGYLMADAVLIVIMTVSICLSCLAIYRMIAAYDQGLQLYQERSNAFYESVFAALPDCEACRIDESD